MLWYEAVEQLKAGRVLAAPSRAQWSRPGAQVRVQAAADGWVVEDEAADSANAQAHFERLEMALLDFERRVGQIGLIGAVAANRYAFLFPNGSSLSWNRQKKTSQKRRSLPIRFPRLRKVG